MRTEISVAELEPRRAYRLLTSTVLPRPIAWVSSRSADGVDNLAPHSFFTVASSRPPVVQFTSTGVKDTLRNVRATEEFVVNLAPEWLQREINETGTDFPPGVSEFAAVGIETEPSRTVAPPRVAGSPVALECRLHQLVEVGDSTLVLGEVLHVAVAEQAMSSEDDLPLPERLAPMARLGRNQWATLGEIREVPRETYAQRQQRLAD